MSPLASRREDCRDLSSASVEFASFSFKTGWVCQLPGRRPPSRPTCIRVKIILVQQFLIVRNNPRVLPCAGAVLDNLVLIPQSHHTTARNQRHRQARHRGYAIQLCRARYVGIAHGHALFDLVIDAGFTGAPRGRTCAWFCEFVGYVRRAPLCLALCLIATGPLRASCS